MLSQATRPSRTRGRGRGRLLALAAPGDFRFGAHFRPDLSRPRRSRALGRRLRKAYDLAYAHALATYVPIDLGEPRRDAGDAASLAHADLFASAPTAKAGPVLALRRLPWNPSILAYARMALIVSVAMASLGCGVPTTALVVAALCITPAARGACAGNCDAGEVVDVDEPIQAIVAGTVNVELAVVGGSGVLGGTVGVVIRLSNDVATAALAGDLDIGFPTNVVGFQPPVRENCRIDPRLAATHQVGGTVPRPGLLRFAIFSATSLDPWVTVGWRRATFTFFPTPTSPPRL